MSINDIFFFEEFRITKENISIKKTETDSGYFMVLHLFCAEVELPEYLFKVLNLF